MGNLLEERLGKNSENTGNMTSLPAASRSRKKEPESVRFSDSDISESVKRKKKRKKEPEMVRLSDLDMPEFNEAQFIEEEMIKDANLAVKFERKRVRNAFAEKVIKVVLVISILYVAFLIYGTIVTDYVYDEDGNVVPQVYTVEEIREEKNFEMLRAYYINIRDLYETIIILDYRLGLGNEDFVQLASEYESLLVDVNRITVQIDAYTPPLKYNQIRSQLLQLIKTDIAVYLQNVSAALAQNDNDKAAKAIVDKETVYNHFAQATDNIISLGENIKGAEIYDIKDWSVHKVQQSFGILERSDIT